MAAAEHQDTVPPVGARLQVHQPSGKWAEAAVVAPEGARAPPGLPHCLQYKDSLEWVRFVSTGVLEGWAQPPGKKGAAAAAAGPPSSAVTVRPFVVLPEGASTKGRPRREVKEAMDAAMEAVELYQQQRGSSGGGGSGDSSDGNGGSPAKLRRLSAAADGSRAANGGAAPPQARQQHAQHGSPGADATAAAQQRQADEAGAPSVKDIGPGAAPSTGGKRRRPGGQPQQQPSIQQQQPPPQQPSQQEPAEGEQLLAAADLSPALQAAEVQAALQHASEPAGQPAAEQPAAAAAQPEPVVQAKAPPKPPAVTELGLGLAMLAPLATVPVGDDEREKGKRPAAASPPGSSKQRPSSQREQRPTQQQRQQREREDGKQQGAAAAPAADSRRPQPGQQEQQQQQQPQQQQQQLHTRPSSRQQPERPPSQQQQAQQAERPPSQPDEGDASPPAAVPVAERPGDKACRAFEALLPGLTLMKDKIHGAAEAAILAGQLGACKEVVHRVLEHMEREAAADKRVPHFYLLDAILAMARKNVEGRGPGSIVGNIFPRVVGAALSQLVFLMGRSLESAQKMEKTLMGTWSVEGKRGVEPSLVQHALEELRRTIARHQSAWEDSSGLGGAAVTDGPASVHGGRPSDKGAAAAGGAGQRSRGPSSGLTLSDEAGMWRMLRKTSLRNALCISFVNIKDGSKMQLMRRWQPDVWPDYSRLPLPPGAEERQFSYQVAVAAAEAQAAEAAGEPPPGGDVSPWYETYDPAYWAAQGFPPEAPRPAQVAAAAAAAASQRMAAAAAQMAQQRLMQQQLRARGQSTAAAAEADEFDAGLFKEAAGGVAAPAGDMQLPLLPDLLNPLGGEPFGAPPLPDQPPLPEGEWEDEEDDFGPPPLPPHSPPRDEYEMDTEGDSPPPLPPGDEDGAPPPLPGSAAPTPPPLPGQQAGQQQAQPQAEAAPPPWAGGYAAQAGHAAGGGQPPAYGHAGSWPGAPLQSAPTPAPAPVPDVPPGFLPPAPAAQQPTPLLPPGIGIQPAAAAAQQQQQVPWMAAQQHQQQQQQQQQQAAWMAQQHQAAAAMMGMPPAAAMQGQAPMMFSPGMPPLMNPAMLQQQAAAAAAAMHGMMPQQLGFTPGHPPGARPPALPPPG